MNPTCANQPLNSSTRRVHFILGLPFDELSLKQAVESIQHAVRTRSRCFFSTPNLNFLVTAQNNDVFRKSVLESDLSLADGMPIVWLARLLGVPIRERVAGSDVFEALRHAKGKQIKVFFFGGPPGVAQQAAEKINSENGGLVCVGFESPGYGSIQEMSDTTTIAKINASGADFLVVSLGAAKGQAWIMHNLAVLNMPVISHLGAVVNFVAGHVSRAPLWMRKTGIEWLWRIKEEPALWRRYFFDGIALIKLLTFKVFPVVFRNQCRKFGITS